MTDPLKRRDAVGFALVGDIDVELGRADVWRYPDLHDPRYELGPQHQHLRATVVDALDEILART